MNPYQIVASNGRYYLNGNYVNSVVLNAAHRTGWRYKGNSVNVITNKKNPEL